jgi:hypothetical protein
MVGDLTDLVGRLRALLPSRWFGDVSPNLDGLLQSIATPWSSLYESVQFAVEQARLATATGQWLDLIGGDFFGTTLLRFNGESDSRYRSRIQYLLFRQAATRQAVALAVEHLTGSEPSIFEPANPADTGAYSSGASNGPGAGLGVAYCTAGGWGSLAMPYQFFLTMKRPAITGLASVAGYGDVGSGYGVGSSSYVDLGLAPGGLTDGELLAAVRDLLPICTVAWVRLQ